MKVFICKFFSDKGIENKIGRLVSREKKRAGNNLRVFCVDERTHEMLKLAGVSSEAFYEFTSIDAEDESTWEKAYELSDELHSSVGTDDTLKYSGINFLTFEHDPTYYIYAIRLARLFGRMLEQNCDVLIVVVPKEYSVWLRNINSPNIKTINYNNIVKSFITWLLHHVLYQGYPLMRGLYYLVKASFQRLGAGHHPVPAQKMDQEQQKVLFVVRMPLYTSPALAICDQCLKDGLIPYAAIDDRTLAPLWQSHHVGYSVKPLFIDSLISLAPRMGKLLALFYRLKKHVNLFFDSSHPDAVQDEFSATYLCKNIILDRLPWLCYEAITDITFLEKVINMTSPDIICVMPFSQYLQQMASALAKEKYNIPVLTCSAAWEIWTASSFRSHLHADKMATSGQKMRAMYIASGLAPERVVATGIAHFDLLFNRNKEQDKQVLLERSVDPAKNIIVIAPDLYFSFRETEEMLIGVIDAVRKIKDMELIIKVYPDKETEPFQTLAEQYHDSRIKVVRDIDLYALLNHCKLLITKNSTAALEAMMIGRPVVTIILSGRSVAVPYAKEGAAVGVYRYEDIEQGIQKALYDEQTLSRLKTERDKFVRNWAGEPDGKASQRIVSLMKEMIGANRV